MSRPTPLLRAFGPVLPVLREMHAAGMRFLVAGARAGVGTRERTPRHEGRLPAVEGRPGVAAGPVACHPGAQGNRLDGVVDAFSPHE